jgi:hypothetical protein
MTASILFLSEHILQTQSTLCFSKTIYRVQPLVRQTYIHMQDNCTAVQQHSLDDEQLQHVKLL